MENCLLYDATHDFSVRPKNRFRTFFIHDIVETFVSVGEKLETADTREEGDIGL